MHAVRFLLLRPLVRCSRHGLLHSVEPACASLHCQIGCGVGNALCPVLAVNRAAVGFGCDFSPTAVACLRAHPQYDAARTHVWVDDITAPAGLCGASKAPERGVDFATLMFVLSAIAPDSMSQVSRRLFFGVRVCMRVMARVLEALLLTQAGSGMIGATRRGARRATTSASKIAAATTAQDSAHSIAIPSMIMKNQPVGHFHAALV